MVTDFVTDMITDDGMAPVVPKFPGARFLNCPQNEVLSFPFIRGSNMVYLDINLIVRDSAMQSVEYAITEGPEELVALPSNITYREEYVTGVPIKAAVEDAVSGQLVECSFTVFFSGTFSLLCLHFASTYFLIFLLPFYKYFVALWFACSSRFVFARCLPQVLLVMGRID